MSHHQANLEPLNILEFLLTLLFVSKAADPCVSSGWPSVLMHNEKELFVVMTEN
jgi:hypothetical protein